MNEARRWRRWRALFLGTLLAAMLMVPLTIGTVSALSWNNETVDTAGDVGEHSSLALDGAGNPRISYYDGSNYDLKYAWKDGSGWHTETADTDGDVGAYTSLALDGAGNPRISYFDYSNYDLKYAWKDGSGWHNTTVDTADIVGLFSSLALDGAGNPRIGYYDSSNGNLKYAWKDGSGWHTEPVDEAGDVGRYSSLALDSAGNPRISYLDGYPNYNLKYAWKDGSSWHTEPVDTAGDVGWYSSLALDGAGNPRISYLDGTNYNLKFAWADLPPTPTPSGSSPSFAAYPQSGPAPHTVQFLDYTPNAQSWRWDFGDGGTSTLQYPTHQYNQSGLYTVTLSVTDWAGATSTKTEYHLIRVTEPVTPAPTPVAAFSANTSTGQAPLAVQFTDTSSPAPYHRWWQFGDGSLSTDADPVHVYERPGAYTVNLTVWTPLGQATVSKPAYVTVDGDPRVPEANFTLSRTSGQAPLYVRFTDTSTGAPTSWRWDFGGFAWTTMKSPSVVFRQPGEFAVTLTVRNPYGWSSMSTNVTVTGAAGTTRTAGGRPVSVVG